ncbi:D-alanyl-D-alanine carboxypeptidase [Anaerotignum lactatifermentans]|uniref:serine-type D-Ala-D-Ala carboxypeptidase n=1 Tax=Anaerotignum lactatifermentans TaxID=160404 RepID=A0ABS2G7Y9_9FIRM|nr:D-alanyl-D-alanine carboxypeptidase [Anaerotignum lactatifermentans]MBM6876683.1 D-alanyl-D-alanine carboxypeptidase [Anaerotignum lactatifermentans]MBM6949737.1 D-alanyl-D-alanine carboxypeptidase [Anaerotignum lactatifermentans]
MKRLWICLGIILLLACPVYGAEPQVAARGAALVDGETGRVLWEYHGDKPMEMASTTKIMTAIMVLEKCGMEEVVTISKNAAAQPDVQMGLKEGEQWYVGDLLRAMMLKSYNDAAVALAEHVSGSAEAFCMEMTARAKSLGAEDTVFGSPNGLDSSLSLEQHHTTAADLGILTAYALKNPVFREIIQLPSHTFSDVTGKLCHTAVNTDRFLQMYDGAIGVKTGYTNKAGNCFVGAAQREDTLLVAVVLGCGWGAEGREQKWKDARVLLDYGYEYFEHHPVTEEEQVCGTVAVTRSAMGEVPLVTAESFSGIFSAEELEKMEKTVAAPLSVEAPVERGMELGTLEISLGGETLARVPLLAGADAPSYTFGQWMKVLPGQWRSLSRN